MWKILTMVLVLCFLTGCGSTSEQSEETTANEVIESQSEELVSEIEEVETEELSQDYSVYNSMEELVISIIDEFGLNQDAVSVAYHHFPTETEFFFNEREMMYAGSTTKVGLVRLFEDKIFEGDLTLQSELPYNDSLYEPGAGRITNGEKKASYPLYELFNYSLAQSDNTAFNILFSYYQQAYGNVQQALLNLSGLDFPQPEATTNNMADAHMLLNILLPIATEERYNYILTALGGNTDAEYFKKHIQDGMLTKYGSINGSLHDTGIYFEEGEPIYALVLMTNGLGNVDDFLGTMNLRINEWTKYQAANN